MQNLKGGWKFLFPKFDSYRDLLSTERLGYPLVRYQSFLGQGILLLAHRIHTHLCSAVNTTFVFHQVFIVFNSCVIQITLMFSRRMFYLTEVITDAVRFQVALQHAEILVDNDNSSNRVILQPEAKFMKTGKL